MRLLRAVEGYNITDHKGNKDTGEEMGLTDIDSIVKSIRTNDWGMKCSVASEFEATLKV
jgi:hypothetical protein